MKHWTEFWVPRTGRPPRSKNVCSDLDEVFGEGYLNTLSPLQSEQYLAIANEALDRVLGPKDGPPTKVQKRLFRSERSIRRRVSEPLGSAPVGAVSRDRE